MKVELKKTGTLSFYKASKLPASRNSDRKMASSLAVSMYEINAAVQVDVCSLGTLLQSLSKL